VFYDTWAYKNSLLDGTAGNDPSGLPLGGSAAVPNGGSGVTGLSGANNTNLVGIHSSQKVQVELLWKF
jgi:hypothetical protein